MLSNLIEILDILNFFEEATDIFQAKKNLQHHES